MKDETLAGELAAIDARLRAVPTQSECHDAVSDLLRFMDKHAPAILAALSPPEAVGDVFERPGGQVLNATGVVHSTPDEQAKAIAHGHALDAEDGGYPTPEAVERARRIAVEYDIIGYTGFEEEILPALCAALASMPDDTALLREARVFISTLAMYDGDAPTKDRFVSLPAVVARRAKGFLASIDAKLGRAG